MYKKKNRFWTFIFSFIPGCAEMYWGLMKQGISLLTVFMAACFIAVMTNIGPLVMTLPVVWFYGFFHARNMAAMSDEELFAVKDEYLLHISDWKLDRVQKNRGIAIVLIAGGAWILIRVLWDLVTWALPEWLWEPAARVYDALPGLAFGVAIIWIGVRLIRGRKRELTQEAEAEAELFSGTGTLPVREEKTEKAEEKAEGKTEEKAEEGTESEEKYEA
ncbi:hypothetical protein [Lachnoclostridium sp. Marseille-P6806]|uniref:hypothetical protein n=1 Tax=Lachnoclostridium sp. Marseille-P6806 TaxID=2364793 RepID=UPI0010302060|nr:hypothetical protein [Lachnoclostridium sp. Marseille-P6806]